MQPKAMYYKVNTRNFLIWRKSNNVASTPPSLKNYKKKYKQINELLKATDISSLVCYASSSIFHNARLNGKVQEGYRRCKKAYPLGTIRWCWRVERRCVLVVSVEHILWNTGTLLHTLNYAVYSRIYKNPFKIFSMYYVVRLVISYVYHGYMLVYSWPLYITPWTLICY